MNNINEDIRKDDHHRQIVIDDDNVTIDDEYDDTSIEETRIDTYRYYHLSELPDLYELQPSISDNFMTKNGYEENKTPRVCFAPSIDQCLMAMSANIKDKEYYVYTPYNIDVNKLRKPTINEVPDSKITGEVWSLEPIKVKCVGKIKVLNAKDISHSYKYGNNTAELWEWEYKLLFNELEVYNVYRNYSLLDEISKESLKKNKDLKPVFVVTTFTSTVLGTIITNFTSTKYSHALISLDPYLRTMYTYDAGGLIIDTIDRYKYDLENSIMCVICIFVTPDIYNSIERDIAYYVKNKNKTHYNLLSLLSNLKGSNQANTFGNLWMMCSEFVDTILKHNNIDLSGSSARNVHPSTFGHYKIRNNQFIIYTGTCADFDGRKIEKTIENLKKTMEYEDLFVMTDNSMKDQYDYNINAINRIPSFFKTGAKYYYGVIGNKINKFKISHEDYRLENSYRELPLPSDIDTDDKPTLVELLDSTDYNHIYLTSDWHLFINIYKKKRYNLINTQEIIKWCKNNIKENDIFMYLGDISFRFASEEHQIKTQEIFKSLPGIKVLIPGNHDKMLGLEYLTGCGFDYIYDSFEYNNLIFTHKPIRMDVYPDDYLNIHGHIHNDRFYKTTDGSRNVNVFPYWYGNKPVTLQYLLDNWKDLVKDNYWLNNAGYGESLLYTDTYYKQDIINESSLSNYKKIPLNKENINKYKKDYPALKHIRENNTGYLFIDNDKLVAVIAVEHKEDGSIWGTVLEIFNPYKNKGLSYKLLDVATKDLGIQYLSVRKTNKLAIHIYEKYGFKSYKETDSQYFMKYSKNLKESTNMINETKRSELPDSAFGIPEDRKYPLDTEKHVRSAIKLFGHAQESKKKALAKRIQSAARKYDITIPENTQCYKYLHEGNTDILDIAENMDNYILAYIDNRVVNIPLNKITWWYIAENKRSSDVDSDLYYKSLEDCAKFKAQDLNNETNHYFDDNLYCEEYVFISNLSFIPEKYSSEEHELINVGEINVFANGEYEWVAQYPIRISDDRIISPMKESMALNAINPVIGINRPFLINTGEKLGLVTDLEIDKMLSVDGNNTLNIEPIDTSGINEFYEFIGNQAYLNKLNEDYRCNNKVDNLYTSLTGKDLYSIDQMEFDEDNFRKIDKDLIEQQTISKFVTFRDNLIESIIGANISMVHLESVVDKSSIPTFVNKYNKLNDIILKEDIDGVYFYSTLSKKRSGSVKDSSLLTENMLKSIL